MNDPHSYARPSEQGAIVSLDWDGTVDLDARALHSTVTLVLDRACNGPLDLDTRGLQVHGVTDADGVPLPFQLGEVDPVLGQRLRIGRPVPLDTVIVQCSTGPGASALMWLEPEQTASGVPFLLTQCQAIHARSLVPVQDTPMVRLTYTARWTLPEGWSAVMSARPGERLEDGRWSFTMTQPIPSYLLALAAGALESRDLGPRCRVWAEPPVLEQAAWEFADVESMLTAAESLYGAYPWERYDFVVLPPSFPLGGMENPRMTFLTPTLLAGDRSLVSVLTHELAHSWTGNLVTSATNEHFWLNEGWTVYAERRILEALYGTAQATEDAVLGRIQLEAVLAERRASGRSNALCYPQQGLDPDEEFSLVPYEKGFLTLVALERAVGRERFDRFVAQYIETFAFSSITTEDFLAFTAQRLPGHGVDLQDWVFGEDLPEDAPSFEAPALAGLRALALAAPEGALPAAPANPTQQLYYLSQLPQLDPATAARVGTCWGLAQSQNAELRSAWLALALRSGVDVLDDARAFVNTVGRTKLLRPVFRALRAVGRDDLADAWLDANRARLHGSTVQALTR